MTQTEPEKRLKDAIRKATLYPKIVMAAVVTVAVLVVVVGAYVL